MDAAWVRSFHSTSTINLHSSGSTNDGIMKHKCLIWKGMAVFGKIKVENIAGDTDYSPYKTKVLAEQPSP